MLDLKVPSQVLGNIKGKKLNLFRFGDREIQYQYLYTKNY